MGNGFSRSREGTDYRQDRALENRGESSRSFNPFKRASKIDKFGEEANTILTKMPESEDGSYIRCLLHRKEMLKLMEKIVDSRPSSYKNIFSKIFENMEENSDNIKEGLYQLVARDLGDCFQSANKRSVKSRLKDKIQGNDNEFYGYFLKEISKCEDRCGKIQNEFDKLERISNNHSLYEQAKRFFKGDTVRYEVMKEYYQLRGTVNHLHNELGLIPDDIFDGRKRLDVYMRIVSKKIKIDDLDKTKWFQDYQKNLNERINIYLQNITNLEKVANNSDKIDNFMDIVDFWDKKLTEYQKRYDFLPDVVQTCTEHQKKIQRIRVDLGRRFGEDEV